MCSAQLQNQLLELYLLHEITTIDDKFAPKARKIAQFNLNCLWPVIMK